MPGPFGLSPAALIQPLQSFGQFPRRGQSAPSRIGTISFSGYFRWTNSAEPYREPPVLTADDIMRIRASGRARANLYAAAERMKRYYARTESWRRESDHNHLRITRIIRSLRLLVGDTPADGFRTPIMTVLGSHRANVSATAIDFWSQA